MNEDYLWDKSGEPDPQIQELEQILAPLRYRPKPLVMPRRNYVPLAIAATLLVALLAGGLWLKFRTQESPQPHQAKSVPSAPSVFKEEPVISNTDPPQKLVPKRRNKPALTKHERQEALAAKEQLLLALRVASEKLKLAQRRTQTPPPNQIKNQHKVG
jgi:negative regulator of sigma E activity